MPKLDTSIDRLVEFVKLKKSCTVDDVAKSLGMPVKQVEELAEILAESGLIDVRYEFSGIRLFPKIVKREAEEKGKTERKMTIADKVEFIKRELAEAENMFVFSEKDIRRKVENAKIHFREIEKMDVSQENMQTLKGKVEELDAFIKVFEEKILSLENAAEEMKQEVDAFGQNVEEHKPGGKTSLRSRIKGFVAKVKGAFRRRKAEKLDIADKPPMVAMQ